MSVKMWSNEEDGILCELYKTHSRTDLATILRRTPSSITNRVNALCLKKGVQRKYNVKHDFFAVPNVLASYWAGFIAADGTVRANASQVTILLAEKDKSHLAQFVKDCGYTGPVKTRRRHKAVVVDVCGVPRWKTDLLVNYRIKPRKSLTLRPPDRLDEDNSIAFMCGLIDGDGTIRIDHNKRLEFSVVGTEAVLKWMQRWFDYFVPSKTRHHAVPRCRVDRGARYWSYKVIGFRAVAIMERLMDVEVPRLWRKWANVTQAVKPIYKCPYEVRVI